MSALVHYSAPALSLAAAGGRLPTWPCTSAYLRACGITDREDLRRWQQRWKAVRDSVTNRRSSTKTQAPPSVENIDCRSGNPGERTPPSGPIHANESTRSQPINPQERNLDELRQCLNLVRQQRGLSIRDISERSRQVLRRDEHDCGGRRWLAPSTVHDALTGHGRIDDRFVTVFLSACEQSPRDSGAGPGGLAPDSPTASEVTTHDVPTRR